MLNSIRAIAVLSNAISCFATEVPDFRPSVAEMALGVARVRSPYNQVARTGPSLGLAMALSKFDLVVFGEYTQLTPSARGASMEGQIILGGVQHQFSWAPRLLGLIPFAEGGTGAAELRVPQIPDLDAGLRPAIFAGMGARMPFGREARFGLKVGYRYHWLPTGGGRSHVDQLYMGLTIYLRPN